MAVTIVDRFHPQRQAIWQRAADEGRMRQVDELALLDEEQLRPLAIFSLWLLLAGGLFFSAFNLIVYIERTGNTSGHFDGGQFFLWLLLNIVSYILILPLHELFHALAFLLWGGKPYFGSKLPLALYCSAKNQMFPRNYYIIVGLAPLVVITLAGLLFILLAPALAPYILFALVGNLSGAAGDIQAVRRLLTLSPLTFIEDSETGYRAWEVTERSDSATIA